MHLDQAHAQKVGVVVAEVLPLGLHLVDLLLARKGRERLGRVRPHVELRVDARRGQPELAARA